MAAGAHFGCPKFPLDRISDRCATYLEFFLQNGCCRPFWMSEISGHFRSIRNFILFRDFLQYGRRRTFWMFENNFRLHFWPFLIDRPFWMSEINFWWHFWPFEIDMQLFFFFFFDKMAAGGHFGWDDNVNYRTRPRYLDE